MYETEEKRKYKVVRFINVIQSLYLEVGCDKLKVYTIQFKSNTRYHNKKSYPISQKKRVWNH